MAAVLAFVAAIALFAVQLTAYIQTGLAGVFVAGGLLIGDEMARDVTTDAKK